MSDVTTVMIENMSADYLSVAWFPMFKPRELRTVTVEEAKLLLGNDNFRLAYPEDSGKLSVAQEEPTAQEEQKESKKTIKNAK